MISFESLGLIDELKDAVRDMGFETPSEIQERAIPLLLEKPGDMLALAQTGTGKTAAFGLPLLQLIDPFQKKTQALVLSPTRELCHQICRELESYAKHMKEVKIVSIYGGASITAQASQIKRGCHIAVATPGRLKDMIGRRMIDISGIDICVLDEADEMLNMGFYEDIHHILSHTPEDKCIWLFSATMPVEVSRIASDFMKDPAEVTVGQKNTSHGNIEHQYYLVGARNRYAALKRLVDVNPGIFSVVFCRTKRDTQKVAEMLIEDGYNAGALHGDLSQQQRDLVMNAFRKRQLQLLVATDVAARGIDIDDITHVINYQLPDEIETYTHRSGRTGRAGKSGISMVLITRSELRKIKSIEKVIGQPIKEAPIPSGMEICEIQLYHLASRIREAEVAEDIASFLPAIDDLLGDIDKDTLVRKIVSVEFLRFYSYYQRHGDQLSTSEGSARDKSGTSRDSSGGSQRYFINLGEKDGFDWASLKDFIRETTDLSKNEVFKVATKGNFSFFTVDEASCDQVDKAFTTLEFKGRPVKVERSGNPDPAGHGRQGKFSKGKGKFNKGKGKGKQDGKRRKGPKGGGKEQIKGFY